MRGMGHKLRFLAFVSSACYLHIQTICTKLGHIIPSKNTTIGAYVYKGKSLRILQIMKKLGLYGISKVYLS